MTLYLILSWSLSVAAVLFCFFSVAYHSATRTIVAACFRDNLNSVQRALELPPPEIGCLVLTDPDFKTSIRYGNRL